VSNIYSDWQKIDLHIHTDWSKRTKQGDYKGSFSIETLYEKLVEQNVQIFSLTDHNIINLPAYKKYYKNHNSKSDPLLLLGVELDIERKEKTYHSLLIFNYCNYEKAVDVNDRLEKIYEEKNANIKKRTVSIDELVNVFSNDDFFLIPHAGNSKNSIIKGYEKDEIEEAQKMIILFQSPLEKVAEKSKQMYNENFDKVLHEAFRNKEDYAYIEFSDNHNIEKYPCIHKGNNGDHDFYYIKGSKNYETLRLAFIDPKSRIRSSSEFKTLNQNRNYIESLDIKSSSKINDTSLKFSSHLNVIIGGRSSGKSLLMDILNRSIDTLKKNSKYDSILDGAEIKIKSKYDEFSNIKTTIDTSIVQINQGDIVNYFENNKLEELAKKTGKIELYNQAKEEFSNKKDILNEKIKDLHKEYKNVFDLDITKNIILHNRIIERVLSSEFLIKVDTNKIKKDYEKLENLTTNKTIITNLLDEVKKFKKIDYFSFTSDELQKINNFETLLNSKKQELKDTIAYRTKIDLFLKEVNQNIKTANSELTTEGQEKAQAKLSIKNMFQDIRNLFNSLVKLNKACSSIENYDYSHKESIELDLGNKLCLEVQKQDEISSLIRSGIKDDESDNKSFYLSLLNLLYGNSSVKNHKDNRPDSFKKKTNSQLSSLLSWYEEPNDFLEYKDGSNSKNNSPGYNSEKYLQVILNNPSSNLILIDQPEDNLGNKFISDQLVDLIRELKFKKQLFLVTHNPAIVVYGDAESIIFAENQNNKISYSQVKLENESSQRNICGVLDGGEYIFDNRARKYNISKLLNRED
jgi:predicted ATP-dependent endonuclease of OLD family